MPPDADMRYFAPRAARLMKSAATSPARGEIDMSRFRLFREARAASQCMIAAGVEAAKCTNTAFDFAELARYIAGHAPARDIDI